MKYQTKHYYYMLQRDMIPDYKFYRILGPNAKLFSPLKFPADPFSSHVMKCGYLLELNLLSLSLKTSVPTLETLNDPCFWHAIQWFENTLINC